MPIDYPVTLDQLIETLTEARERLHGGAVEVPGVEVYVDPCGFIEIYGPSTSVDYND